MTIEVEKIEWEKPNGERMSNGEFIMHHSCKTHWEQLGIYPVHDHFVKDGIYMKNVEFKPEKYCSFKVTVNEDSTVNFEIFSDPTKQNELIYGKYLKHVDEINQELRLIRENMTED